MKTVLWLLPVVIINAFGVLVLSGLVPLPLAIAADVVPEPLSPPVTRPAVPPPAPATAAPSAPTVRRADVPARLDGPEIQDMHVQAALLRQREQDLQKASELGLGQMLTRLQQSIEALQPGDRDGERRVVFAMQGVIKELRTAARVVLSRETEYRRQLQLYANELATAPAKYRAAAEVFAALGREETVKELKERYERHADTVRQIAELIERRGPELRQEQTEVLEAFRFIARSERYLEALSALLAGLPDFAAGAARQKEIAALRDFVAKFRSLDDSFDKFAKKLSTAVSAETAAK